MGDIFEGHLAGGLVNIVTGKVLNLVNISLDHPYGQQAHSSQALLKRRTRET